MLPDFDYKRPLGMDLAILVLIEKFKFESCAIQPVTLPPPGIWPRYPLTRDYYSKSDLLVGQTCSFYGWGLVTSRSRSDSVRSELRVVQTELAWTSECITLCNAKTKVPYNHTICTKKRNYKSRVVICSLS